MTPAHVLERVEHGVARDAERAQEVTDTPGDLGHREQDVLGREVVVVEPSPLAVGSLEELVRLGRQLRLLRRRPIDLGDACQRLVDAVAHHLGRHAHALEHRQDDALGLAHQRREQVLGRDLAVVPLACQRLGRAEGLAGLAGELVGVEGHGPSSVRCRS